MDITLSLSITDGDEAASEHDIIHFSKSINPDDLIGLSLAESKALLKTLQQHIVEHQACKFIQSQVHCPCCRKITSGKRLSKQLLPHGIWCRATIVAKIVLL